MKPRTKMMAAAALLIAGFAGSAVLRAESEYDFTLVNCTAYAIDEVYIAPSSSTAWGKDVMGEGTLPPKSYVAISFHPAASAARWDMMIKWAPIGGQTYPPEVWKNLDLAKIHQLNLYYNKNTDVTTAKWKDEIDHSCD